MSGSRSTAEEKAISQLAPQYRSVNSFITYLEAKVLELLPQYPPAMATTFH
jgi:hypothetical protein